MSQLSQTPDSISDDIILNIDIEKTYKVLEPCFGNGTLIVKLIDKFIPLYKNGTIEDKIDWILNYNIWGYEIDEFLYDECIDSIISKWGFIPKSHNLKRGDFLLSDLRAEFDYVIMYPPDEFDEIFDDDEYSRRDDIKMYGLQSYFISKSMDYISENGIMIVLFSNDFKSHKKLINTREYLLRCGSIEVSDYNEISKLVLKYNTFNDFIIVNDNEVNISSININKRCDWSINNKLSSFFDGPSLNEYVYIESGRTFDGLNSLLNDIQNGIIIESNKYDYYEEMVTIQSELEKSPTGNLSKTQIKNIKKMEDMGMTRVELHVSKTNPTPIHLPHTKYKYYTTNTSNILFVPSDKSIYINDDEGYLPGMTWCNNSKRLLTRYVPDTYVISNDLSIAHLKDGIEYDELYYIIAWTLSDMCNELLYIINPIHKSIREDDILKIPYPIWVDEISKRDIINYIQSVISHKFNGESVNDIDVMNRINQTFQQ